MERVLSEFFCPITWSAGRERRRRRQKSMKAPTWGAERERESSKRRCPKSKSRSLMSETRRRASTRCALLFLNNSRVRSWAYAHNLMFSEAADKLDLPFSPTIYALDGLRFRIRAKRLCGERERGCALRAFALGRMHNLALVALCT